MIIISLMVIRDEDDYIDFNIRYQLDIGFDLIAILDHCSMDKTKDILSKYQNNQRVFIYQDNNPVFDHGKLVNKLLSIVKSHYQFDWVFTFDADEFLGIKDEIHYFIDNIERKGIVYGSIRWLNALFDSTQVNEVPIGTNLFYSPWPERSWQHEGHFRKSFAKNHQGIEVVVGGHYFRAQNNLDFFTKSNGKPYLLPLDEAKLFHFEHRSSPIQLLNKWKKLAQYERDSSSKIDAPWMERIHLIRDYATKFSKNPDLVDKYWFKEHRTLWGTVIPYDRIIVDSTLQEWLYHKEIIN